MKFTKFILLSIVCGLFVISCSTGPTPGEIGEKPSLTVTILPQKYFVKRIVGEKFEVNVMIPPGHNPATYAPTPLQMRAVSRSILYLKCGHILFESAWLNNIVSNTKGLKIVDTSIGVEPLKGTDIHVSDQDPVTGIDPHMWLSPKAVKIQAKNILDAVIDIDGKNRDFYESNYSKFIADIDRLDNEIKSILEKCSKKKFIVFHPAWGYFARDYGLEQVSIENEGKSPSPADMKSAIDVAKSEDIHIIFIQQQFDTNLAASVADEIKGQLVVLDPLAEDWMANMKRMATALSQSLK
jgi:zinc transport system substrate-binding protein